ncbi:MAG: preprotein translocase subunit SecG [Oscillospiraceae bacterium]|nr:preprotein translocase subunit SecG [Oscillospiraceae bacterium]
MEIYEIICGAIVLALSLLIIILCLMQDAKTQQNMTSALGGGSNESFYGQNEGNTREAALQKLTKVLGIIAVVVIVCMNIVIPIIVHLTQSGAAE